jgi:hypothetical protein
VVLKFGKLKTQNLNRLTCMVIGQGFLRRGYSR